MAITVETIVNGTKATPTASPTANSVPVSDGAGKLAAGWGGAASSLATLSGSSLVVQNPASANATPGNAVIPIADGSGDLDVGFVPDRVGRWFKFTKTFGDFSTAGLTNDIEVLSLPVRGVITKVVLKHTTAFSGGAIASYTVSVGITGNFIKYAAAFDVFQATGNTVFGFNNLQNMENFGAAVSIRAQATATGANLDQAAAGSVDIYVHYSVLP
jgi:hypothetical protein